MSMFDLLADRLVEDEFSDLLSLRLEVHQAEVHQAEVHEAEVHQAEVHQAEVHEAEVHQAIVHQAEVHQAEVHQAIVQAEVHQAEVHEAIVVHQAKVPKRKRYTHWVDGRRVKTSQPGATPMTRKESCKEARHGKTEQELKKAQRPMV
jgi:ribosomal protein L14